MLHAITCFLGHGAQCACRWISLSPLYLQGVSSLIQQEEKGPTLLFVSFLSFPLLSVLCLLSVLLSSPVCPLPPSFLHFLLSVLSSPVCPLLPSFLLFLLSVLCLLSVLLSYLFPSSVLLSSFLSSFSSCLSSVSCFSERQHAALCTCMLGFMHAHEMRQLVVPPHMQSAQDQG